MNSIADNKHEVNPCLGCVSYDPDFGCTMPPFGDEYACPLVPDDEIEKMFRVEFTIGDEQNDKT